MHKTNFKKQLLTSSIAMLVASAAGAQESAGVQEEELIVTGIRASIKAAMDIKRDSSGVVDAINAEDIGKFPDSNLAESLQRITGVSIDRQNGEGTQVTVRGFGPQFNLITLNGRAMPSSQLSINGAGLFNNRSFDMSNIASEGVSGVEVYKTGRASIASGGIGAAINLKTRRPLDSPGIKFSIGAKALHDTTTRVGDDVTPEISSFGSWTNDSETFGVALSMSHQRRHSAQTGAVVDSWSDKISRYNGPNSINDPIDDVEAEGGEPTVVDNPPDNNQLFSEPNILRYYHADRERKRTNGQLTVQFRPVESLTATLDYTLAHQDIRTDRAELSAWFSDFATTDVQFDDSSVATPLYYWQESRDANPRDLNYGVQGGDIENRLRSVGLNVEWQATDRLSFALDYHDSKSESIPADGAVGNWYNVGIGAAASEAQGLDFSGDLPIIGVVFNDRFIPDPDNPDDYDIRDGGRVVGEIDIEDLGSTVRQINYERTWSEIQQLKLDGSFELSENSSINFGIESREMENLSRSSQDQTVLEGGWSVANPGDIPEHFIEPLNFGSLFDGYSSQLSNGAQSYFDSAYQGEGGVETLINGYIGDANALGALLSWNAGLSWEPSPNDNTNRLIKEEVNSVYLEFSGDYELAGFPVHILAGVRYEDSDIESETSVALPTVVWQGNNDFNVQSDPAVTVDVSGSASYSHTLPSLDLSIDFTDNLIARASYSTTIARPDYDDLALGTSNVGTPSGGPTLLGGGPAGANNGDPGLEPIESDNYDISIEWYYADSSYASIGYFYKDVPNFIGSSPEPQTFAGVRDASNGPRAIAAREELQRLGIGVTDTNLFAMVASMNTTATGCVNQDPDEPRCGMPYDTFGNTEEWENFVDIVPTEDDPLLNLLAQVPVNSQDANLEGIEVAVQHFFGESGFGVQANYTWVDGSIGYDIDGDPSQTQFALVGLSDTANLALLFENYGFQARIAYNWRDSFLDNSAVNVNEPQFTEEYSQIDFNIGYNVTDNFIVALEGINITEEDKRQHGRSSRQLKNLEILGARYSLSARYTF